MSKKINSNTSFTNSNVDIHKDYSKIYADKKAKQSLTYHTSKPMFKSIFVYIVLVLFVIAYSHYIRTGTFIDFSFKSLIDRLADMPDVSISFTNIDLTINGDWGVVDFLRDFLNYFTSCFEVILTLTGFVVQGFIVIFFLVSLFFV